MKQNITRLANKARPSRTLAHGGHDLGQDSLMLSDPTPWRLADTTPSAPCTRTCDEGEEESTRYESNTTCEQLGVQERPMKEECDTQSKSSGVLSAT